MFDKAVPANGYAWWYVDGVSDDHKLGVTIIAFVGSVFSPFYFAARKGGALVDPEDFCAINVALYQRKSNLWGFTEWPRKAIDRSEKVFEIGANRVLWDRDKLEIQIDDQTAPGRQTLRGKVTVRPEVMADGSYPLDPAGRHLWGPIAPSSRIEVAFDEPAWGFAGIGYFDSNEGAEPVEAGMRDWTWSRHPVGKDTVVFYDAVARDGIPYNLARRFKGNGDVESIEAPPERRLPRTRMWAFPRSTRGEDGFRPRAIRTLEASPFYARSLVESVVCGQQTIGVHESLSLDRFKTRWMQLMLPFRMIKRP